MPQSLSRIWLHLVFSTKGRRAYLRNEELREEMFRMLGHRANECDSPAVRCGGFEDHVHVLCGLARTMSVAKLVETLKVETSKWAKGRQSSWRGFQWQNGYGAFSVSQSLVDQVTEYVDSQPQHHARMSFQDEFRQLCAKHRLPIDERYVWD